MRGEALEPMAFEQCVLHQFSPSFRALYDHCMDRIDLTVLWFYEAPDERRSITILERIPGEAHIGLPRKLPTHIAELHAAEELWHVLQYCEGFCPVVPHPHHIIEWEPVAVALSSLFLDPLAYKAMTSFGLDLEPFFRDAIDARRADLEDIRLMVRNSERGDLRKHWGALLNYASTMLELPPPFLEEVESICRPEFPELWQTAEDLVVAIRGRGFDTPRLQCDLLRSILEENQLTQYLTLSRRFVANHR